MDGRRNQTLGAFKRPGIQPDAASFMILLVLFSTSCATPSGCGTLNIARRVVGFQSGQNAALRVNGDSGMAVEWRRSCLGREPSSLFADDRPRRSDIHVRTPRSSSPWSP